MGVKRGEGVGKKRGHWHYIVAIDSQYITHTSQTEKKTYFSLKASSKNTFYSIFRVTSYFHHTHFISRCRYNYCLLFFQQVETVLSLSLSLCVSEECSSLATAQPLPGNNKNKLSWHDIRGSPWWEILCIPHWHSSHCFPDTCGMRRRPRPQSVKTADTAAAHRHCAICHCLQLKTGYMMFDLQTSLSFPMRPTDK